MSSGTPGRLARRMRGLAASFGALGIAACGWILPERFAVNAPLLHLVFGVGTDTPSEQALDRISVPEGFQIGVYADGVQNARLLRFTDTGDLLVSSPYEGQVVLLARDADGDGRADARRTLLEGLNRPHGIDLRGGWLYVAESDGVGRVRLDESTGRIVGSYERLFDLPDGGRHYTRTLRFGPDGGMYVSIGSSCNVCEESDPRRASILRVAPGAVEPEIFATGLRNAVGFDWQPGTDVLYATDNGRDLLGDDFPPCELNRVERGGFYGWPYANADRRLDPDLGSGNEAMAQASIAPAHAFGAHTAPLGITFLRDPRQPVAYRSAALVALHGSWNRTRKAGYQVVSLHWQPDGSVIEREFATGFERDEQVIGRPVDVIEGPDAAIYLSDDYTGTIYRIARGSPASTSASPTRGPRRTADPLEGLSFDERASASARGLVLYESHGCAGCHETGRPMQGVVAAPLRDLGSRYDLDSLAAFLVTPTPPMPPLDLPEAQRRDLAVHLLQHHP